MRSPQVDKFITLPNAPQAEETPADVRTLLALFASQGPGPCADCPSRRQCGEQKLACYAYAVYVQQKRTIRTLRRSPTRHLFDLVEHLSGEGNRMPPPPDWVGEQRRQDRLDRNTRMHEAAAS